jgi:hypothetical protein
MTGVTAGGPSTPDGPEQKGAPMSDGWTEPGGQERRSTMEKCPTCGTTKIEYDPPLEFKVVKACGQIKPGNYSTNDPRGLIRCEMPKDHEPPHIYLVEYLEKWT